MTLAKVRLLKNGEILYYQSKLSDAIKWLFFYYKCT